MLCDCSQNKSSRFLVESLCIFTVLSKITTDERIIYALIGSGADPYQETLYGRVVPLWQACSKTRSVVMIFTLLTHPDTDKKLRIKNNFGRPPLAKWNHSYKTRIVAAASPREEAEAILRELKFDFKRDVDLSPSRHMARQHTWFWNIPRQPSPSPSRKRSFARSPSRSPSRSPLGSPSYLGRGDPSLKSPARSPSYLGRGGPKRPKSTESLLTMGSAAGGGGPSAKQVTNENDENESDNVDA